VGEHAPHYLYKSYSTARRIRETLPHVKVSWWWMWQSVQGTHCILCLACLYTQRSNRSSLHSVSPRKIYGQTTTTT
jgi:hypothetical protein